jgi:hypothetical protein
LRNGGVCTDEPLIVFGPVVSAEKLAKLVQDLALPVTAAGTVLTALLSSKKGWLDLFGDPRKASRPLTAAHWNLGDLRRLIEPRVQLSHATRSEPQFVHAGRPAVPLRASFMIRLHRYRINCPATSGTDPLAGIGIDPL